MGYFLAIGIIALVSGVMFIFAPSAVRSLNERSTRIISSFDAVTLSYRIGVGVVLVIASGVFFYAAYFMKRHGFYLF
ncbi:MAG: hypothetical protein HY894_01350 [Deltaproteobacteria bacterium]|nr:hypothetical protein [Deltaproteobacteria bacterium]